MSAHSRGRRKQPQTDGPGIYWVISLNDYPKEVATKRVLALTRRDELQAQMDRAEQSTDKHWEPLYRKNVYNVERVVIVPAEYDSTIMQKRMRA